LADLGKLGPKEGEAVTFIWKRYYSGASLVLWATLILAIGLPKSNRSRAAMLVLVPICITVVVWTTLRRALPLDSMSEEMFTIVVYSLVVGIGILWLLGDKIGRRGAFVRILCAVGILCSVSVLAFLGYKVDITTDLIPFILLMGLLAVIHAVGFLLTRRKCCGNYDGRRFGGWLALWMMAGAPVVTVTFVVVVCLTVEETSDLPEAVPMALVIGTVFGFTVYIINQLFLSILLKAPLYRGRFHACLSLDPVVPSGESALPEA
jgi:predicted neutral ceramidase superfamily lipid hydrolase